MGDGTVSLVSPTTPGQRLAFTDLLLRIGVGIVSFLAVATLLLRTSRRRRRARERAPRHWLPCPGCGGVVRAKAEGWKNVCPECGEELNLSSAEAISVPGEQQDVSDYMKALVKSRQKRKGT
jgi:hypothetical protein